MRSLMHQMEDLAEELANAIKEGLITKEEIY